MGPWASQPVCTYLSVHGDRTSQGTTQGGPSLRPVGTGSRPLLPWASSAQATACASITTCWFNRRDAG